MTANSLSRLAHGRLPVAISNKQQPNDQISMAPNLPIVSPLIVSGDMYIGVPVNACVLRPEWRIEFKVAVPEPLPLPPLLDEPPVVFEVLPCAAIAITLAEPKSTNLMTPMWSSSMFSGLMSLCTIPN
ncbi:hypothetical protein OGATHE_002408 [Ogataea polymorpha]|uniref:Uncharacterized protein n=1 Tax=Ogataea polymorpha TaxID=460523 RepID=A0A9P8PD36_9ASCO|nr:hypothetical protein OGATHE_002408 [Ogataea polymorpha]